MKPPAAILGPTRLLAIRASEIELLVAFINDQELASRIFSIVADPERELGFIAFVRVTPDEARKAARASTPPLLTVTTGVEI